MINWLSEHYIEIFGAITGIIYVILEIRQALWLWPLGIITSGAYVWIFFSGKLYADMSLQAYYVVISILGWYWWVKGAGQRAQGSGRRAQGSGRRAQGKGRRAKGNGQRVQDKNSPFEGGQGDVKLAERDGLDTQSAGQGLTVTRIKLKLAVVLFSVLIVLYAVMFFILSRLTDSPVPEWDAFLTSLSIIATWMLARKIYEHWYLWIMVNTLSVGLYFWRGLYPTVVLYAIYGVMSFIGLKAWKKTIADNNVAQS
jgi:nicotinamide mononucleotide transporter